MSTDKEAIYNQLLVIRCRQGQEDAWSELVNRWEKPLLYPVRLLQSLQRSRLAKFSHRSLHTSYSPSKSAAYILSYSSEGQAAQGHLYIGVDTSFSVAPKISPHRKHGA